MSLELSQDLLILSFVVAVVVDQLLVVDSGFVRSCVVGGLLWHLLSKARGASLAGLWLQAGDFAL